MSIPPQAGIVRAIGGDRVAAEALVRPGQDPHTYEASPRQIATLAGAAIYFQIGLPFEEALLARIASFHSHLQIADMGRGVTRLLMNPELETAERDTRSSQRPQAGGAHVRSSESSPSDSSPSESPHSDSSPSGSSRSVPADSDPLHSHEFDPHIWLSPKALIVLGRRTAETLEAIDPAGAETYAGRLAAFEARVAEMDGRAAALLDPFRGRSLCVYHPAFGYFASAYGLRQVAVERGGREPSPRQLAEFIRRARAEGVRAIFVQPQFDARSARSVADAIGAEIIALDDLAEDPVTNLETLARRIAESFSPAGR